MADGETVNPENYQRDNNDPIRGQKYNSPVVHCDSNF